MFIPDDFDDEYHYFYFIYVWIFMTKMVTHIGLNIIWLCLQRILWNFVSSVMIISF